MEEFDWKTITFENAKNIAEIIAIQKTTNITLATLARDMTKIDEVILTNGQIKRDVADIKKQMDLRAARVEEDRKKLKWAYVVAEYPKLSVAFISGLYIFALKDVRDAIGIQLQPTIEFIKLLKGLF